MNWIIGDIHGHRESLDTVLAKIKARDPLPSFYAVGDLVDRGPDDQGVIDRVIAEGIRCVRGNHDDAYDKSHSDFIASLPESIDAGSFVVVHEPPIDSTPSVVRTTAVTDRVTYCGHMTVARVTATGNVINVDTGCGEGGPLSAICHETREVVSSASDVPRATQVTTQVVQPPSRTAKCGKCSRAKRQDGKK